MSVTYSGDIGYKANGDPFAIGETGVGSLVVNGGSTETFDGNVNSEGIFLQLGATGTGDGTVTVAGSGSTLEFIGIGDNNTGMSVGGPGLGRVNVTAGGTLTMQDVATIADAYVGFSIGRPAGGNGFVNVNNGTIDFDGWGVYANIGRDGGAGRLDLKNGSVLDFTGDQSAGMQIGRAGGLGILDIDATSSATLTAGSAAPDVPGMFNDVYFNVGRDGGDGTVNVAGGALTLESTIGEAGANIGRDGGNANGEINVTAGGLMEIKSSAVSTFINVGRGGPAVANFDVTDSAFNMVSTGSGTGAFLNIGRDGAVGFASFDNAQVSVTSQMDFATIRLGMDFGAPGGDGSMTLKNGSDITLAGDTARFSIGYTANSSGDLKVLSGSTIDISHTSGTLYDSLLIVGYEANVLSATALISGSGSSINSMDAAVIGYTPLPGDLDTGQIGNGRLTIANGGTLEATEAVAVGRGGTLILNDGTVNTTNPGGVFSVLDGLVVVKAGSVNQIVGDVEIFGSSNFTFEVAADGSSVGQINHFGSSVFSDFGHVVTFKALGGYQYSAGDNYQFAVSIAATFPDNFNTTFNVTGQNASFGYSVYATETVGIWSANFEALSNGDGSGGPAILNFGGSTTSGATFEYFTNLGSGSGTGGSLGEVDAYNISEIRGTNTDDVLSAIGGGDMTLRGRDGDDVLNGDFGADLLLGGAGNDILRGGSGNDVELGASGNDNIYGDDGDDVLNGLSGNDVIFGGDGVDRLIGSTGDDVLNSGSGNDFLNGGGGNDQLRGGSGDDRMIGASGDDSLLGQLGNDRLISGSGNNFLDGGTGDDILSSATGVDILIGGSGNDILHAGTGADMLNGGTGNDLLNGFVDGEQDTYLFDRSNWGIDRITNYEDGIDIFDMTGSGVMSLGDLTITQLADGSALLSRTPQHSIRIDSTSIALIDGSDFIFDV